MQNLPQVNIPTLPISDPKTQFDGNPNNSLKRIFEHYMNSSNNEVLSDESKCFENIFKKKDNLFTKITHIKSAMELIHINPHNRQISKLYEIIKERFTGDQQEIKNAEKARFIELIQINSPPTELTLMLLQNIDKFSLKSDFHIIEKLNSSKENSKDCKKIFDETVVKFKACLDENERKKFDKEIKNMDRILSRRISFASFSSTSSPAGSQPPTPSLHSNRGSFELFGGIEPLPPLQPSSNLQPTSSVGSSQQKKSCIIC